MKILFVQSLPFEHMGIMHISSLVKARGHQASALLVSDTKDYLKEIEREEPDFIGFSCITGMHVSLLELAASIKQQISVPLVWGGPHPTFMKDFIEDPRVDVVCRGEGEYATLDLLERAREGDSINDIPNLWVKQNGEIYRNELRDLIADLDSLPPPDREIYYNRYPFLRESTLKFFRISRGCPFKCSYCHQHIRQKEYRGKGEFVRMRNADRVIEEMKECRSRWGLEVVDFLDDLFNYSESWLLNFLPMYQKEIGLPFHCQGVGEMFSDELIKAMKKAGCHGISVALETSKEQIRRDVLNKTIDVEAFKRAARSIKDHGILLRIYNILGVPGETSETTLQTLRLNIEIRPTIAWASLCQPYPGTDLYNYALKNGFLDKDFSFDQIQKTFRNRSVFKMKDLKEITNIQKFFSLVVKFPFLFRVLGWLIRIPSNRVFDAIFYLTYGLQIKQINHMNWKSFIRQAVRASKYSV